MNEDGIPKESSQSCVDMSLHRTLESTLSGSSRELRGPAVDLGLDVTPDNQVVFLLPPFTVAAVGLNRDGILDVTWLSLCWSLDAVCP